jgi:hypothetical protein
MRSVGSGTSSDFSVTWQEVVVTESQLAFQSLLLLLQMALNLRPIPSQKVEKPISDSIWLIRSPGENDFNGATSVTQGLENHVWGTKLLYAAG